MSDEQNTGISSILGGFAAFRDGVEATPVGVHEVEHTVTEQTVTINALHVNGALPGVPVVDTFWVDIRQVELAPAEDLLVGRYSPDGDKDFGRYCAGLEKLGDEIPPLTVLPANRDITIEGKTQHMYLVYDEPVVFYACLHNKRVRVKIRVVKIDPDGPHGAVGPLLMEALAHKGLMHRPPSQLEICETARRLHEVYRFTCLEIAMMESAHREDLDQPSEQTIQAQIAVARLPEPAKLLFHKGALKWSAAKAIAWKFNGDTLLCTQLATLAIQGGGMNILELEATMQRVKDKLVRLETDANDVVAVVPLSPTMQLLPERKPKKLATPSFPTTSAPSREIIKAASRFGVEIEEGRTPDQPVVTLDSFDGLSEWMNDLTAPPTVAAVEATVYGWMAALHRAEEAAGLLNQKGQIGPTVDSKSDSREA